MWPDFDAVFHEESGNFSTCFPLNGEQISSADNFRVVYKRVYRELRRTCGSSSQCHDSAMAGYCGFFKGCIDVPAFDPGSIFTNGYYKFN
jgi:hypothetical protein